MYQDAAGNVYDPSQVICVDADGNTGPCSIFSPAPAVGKVYDENGNGATVTLYDSRPPAPNGGVVMGRGPFVGRAVGVYAWGPSPDCTGDDSQCPALWYESLTDPDFIAWSSANERSELVNAGGWRFSLTHLYHALAPVVVGALSGAAVGGVTTAQAVGNVELGRSVSENLTNAAAVDAAGAALVGGTVAAGALSPSGELVGVQTSEVALPNPSPWFIPESDIPSAALDTTEAVEAAGLGAPTAIAPSGAAVGGVGSTVLPSSLVAGAEKAVGGLVTSALVKELLPKPALPPRPTLTLPGAPITPGVVAAPVAPAADSSNVALWIAGGLLAAKLIAAL